MKEFLSYTKIDKILGPYTPDLVLSNGCSCPIDIEIDEPYDFQTRKEIHYIGGAEILPPPLNPEQEASCIKMLYYERKKTSEH